MVKDSGAKLLFLDATTADSLKNAGDANTIRISLDGSDCGKPFAEWLAPEGAAVTPVTVDPADPFNIIYSSGTTGIPKGIVQSHRMRWAHVQRANAFQYNRTALTLLSTYSPTIDQPRSRAMRWQSCRWRSTASSSPVRSREWRR